MGISVYAMQSYGVVDYTPETAVESEKRFLGISAEFGRWESGLVRWAYNSANAPTLYSDTSSTISIIQSAMAEWEAVSGLHFEYQGSGAHWDGEKRDDGVVVVEWSSTKIALPTLGKAGPHWLIGSSDYLERGYPDYTDGTFYLNPNAVWTDRKLESTVLHELGHLVGLGHSDNPDSVMYANPYNHLQHLRDDDIAAVQALYGRPAALQRVAPEGLPGVVRDDRFTGTIILPATGEDATETLFSDDASATTVVVSVTHSGTVPKFEWVVFATGGQVQGNYDRVFVDPQGYRYDSDTHSVDCNKNYICRSSVSGALTSDILRTQPGIWTVDLRLNGTPVHRMQIEVADDLLWNRPPTGRLQVDQAISFSPMSANAQLDVSDSEGDEITAAWHYPGLSAAPSASPVDVSDQQSIVLNEATDTHLFVVLNDPNGRYPNSGEGFRSLLRHPLVVMGSPGAGTATDLAVTQNVTWLTESTDTAQLSVDIANQGTAVATQTEARIIIPQATYLKNPLPAGCVANAERDLLTCQMDNLAAGTKQTLQFQLTSTDRSNDLWSFAGVVSPTNGDGDLTNNLTKINLSGVQLSGDATETVRVASDLTTMAGSWSGQHNVSDQLQITLDGSDNAHYQISWSENGSAVSRSGELLYQDGSDSSNPTAVPRYRLILEQSNEDDIFLGEQWYLYLEDPVSDPSNNDYQVTVYRDSAQNELRLWRRVGAAYPYRCVATALEFENALDDAEQAFNRHGVDGYEIRLQQGDYRGSFQFQQPFATHHLILRGGYQSGCSQLVSGTTPLSTLDASGTMQRALFFNAYGTGHPGSLTLQRMGFSNGEVAQYGGGLRVWSNGGNVTIADSHFSGNRAGLSGGGLWIDTLADSSSTLQLSNLHFSGNQAPEASALYLAHFSETVLQGSTFQQNGDLALSKHAMVRIKNSPKVELTGNRMEANRGQGADHQFSMGAANSASALWISNHSAAATSLSMVRNYIEENGDDRTGAALYSADAQVKIERVAAILLESNLIAASVSLAETAGLYIEQSEAVTLNNNTITANQSRIANCQGCGLSMRWVDSATLNNNLIWGNTAIGDYKDIDFPWKSGMDAIDLVLYNNNYHAPSFGWANIVEQQGNIDLSPQFASGGYQLMDTSPLIDQGGDLGGGVTALDLAAAPRVTNGSIDIGAFEFQGASGTEAPESQFQWVLEPGWNLVGMVLDNTDSLNTLLSATSGRLRAIWHLENSNSQLQWIHYLSDATDSSTLHTLEGGKGYWLRLSEGEPLTVQFEGGTPVASPATLSKGWNMRAPSATSVDLAEFSAVNYVDSVWGWRGGDWSSYHAGTPRYLNSLQRITPTQGYYFYQD